MAKGVGQGKGGGKPLKWNNAEELIKGIENFFNWCEEIDKRPTVTRLAYYLNTDRKTLLDYENSDTRNWLTRLSDDERLKYSHAIKEAKRRIEAEYEDSLFDKSSTTGAIFTLKNNYSWVDKQEIEHTNNNINVELTD